MYNEYQCGYGAHLMTACVLRFYTNRIHSNKAVKTAYPFRPFYAASHSCALLNSHCHAEQSTSEHLRPQSVNIWFQRYISSVTQSHIYNLSLLCTFAVESYSLHLPIYVQTNPHCTVCCIVSCSRPSPTAHTQTTLSHFLVSMLVSYNS